MRSFKAGQTFNHNLHHTIKEYRDADEEDLSIFILFAREELEEKLKDFDDDLEMFALLNAFNVVIDCWKEGRYKINHKH